MLAGGAEVSEQALIDHVKSKIARYKAPAAVEFVDALPQTSTGKIQKYELREREWQGQASRIKG